MTAGIFDVDLISLRSLKQHLDENRWRRTTLKGGFELFALGHDDPIEIVLPTEEKSRDLHLMMGQAIRTLGMLNKIPPDEIIERIRAAERDNVPMLATDASNSQFAPEITHFFNIQERYFNMRMRESESKYLEFKKFIQENARNNPYGSTDLNSKIFDLLSKQSQEIQNIKNKVIRIRSLIIYLLVSSNFFLFAIATYLVWRIFHG